MLVVVVVEQATGAGKGWGKLRRCNFRARRGVVVDTQSVFGARARLRGY